MLVARTSLSAKSQESGKAALSAFALRIATENFRSRVMFFRIIFGAKSGRANSCQKLEDNARQLAFILCG